MIWWAVQQLKSRSRETRLQAVEKLSQEDHPKAWEALIKALEDTDDAVRKAVAQALGNFKDDRTVTALVAALNDPHSTVREAAAQALRLVGSREAIPALADALSDPVGAVRWQAAKALEVMHWESNHNLTRAYHAVALGDIEKATMYGADAVEPLMLVIHDGAYYQRQAAIEALSQIADNRIFDVLLVALKDHEEPVRTAAVEALRRISDQRAVAPLILALKDPHKHVRSLAAEALGQLGDTQAVEPLTKTLADADWEVREAAVFALGRFRDPRSADALIALLADPDREVREAAARVLEQVGDPRAVGPLILALIDPEDTVRQAANYSLQILDPNWPESEIAHAIAPQLKAALKDQEYWVRQSAASILARIGEIKPSEPGATALAEPLHYRRQAAVETLILALHDYDLDLRLAAADALGRIGQRPALPALQCSQQDPDPHVRAAVAQALETIQGRTGTEFLFAPRADLFQI
jgi:HEAT repeat protein